MNACSASGFFALIHLNRKRDNTLLATRPAEVVALILAAPLGIEGMEGAEGASDACHTDLQHINGLQKSDSFKKPWRVRIPILTIAHTHELHPKMLQVQRP